MNKKIKLAIDSMTEMKKLLIDELISQGIAEFEDNKLALQPETLYSLLPSDRRLLGFPEFYPFSIVINNEGNIYKSSSTLSYCFKEHELGDYLFLKRENNLLFENEKLRYILKLEQYSICKIIDEYNSFNGTESDRISLLAKIIQMAKQNEVILPINLQKDNITSINKMSLELKKNPVTEDIELELNANTEEYGFNFNLELCKINPKSRFIKEKTKDHVYRIHFNEEYEKIIKEVKQVNALPPAEKKEYIKSSKIESILETDYIDLANYSKRVIEYGFYKPRYYPLVSAFKSEWLPGVSIDEGDTQEIIYIKDEKERLIFENRIESSIKEDKDFIDYKEHIIPLEEAQELNRFFKKQLSNTKVKPSDKEKKVLIIKENISDLSYSEVDIDQKVNDMYYEDPPNLKSGLDLLDHQKNGVAWLLSVVDSYSGCLLADDMGLGKTLQILSFIDIFTAKQSPNKTKILIVAPVSLLENWRNEYHKFFNPKLNAIIVSSKTNFSKYDDEKLNNSFMLTNYETVKNPKNQPFFGRIQWDIVVIDEAQKIKTPGTRVTNAIKALKSYFKIAMTGTPVENTMLDLWSIIDFAIPGLLGSAKKFKDDFDKPLQTDFSQENLEKVGYELREILGNSFKRRMKIDVNLSLPEKREIFERREMPPIQQQLYMEEVEHENDGTPMLAIIQNLRNISDHPYLKIYNIRKFSTEELINSSAKLMITMEILSEIKKRDEKVIVFTEFRKLQNMLRSVFLDYFKLEEISIINGLTATQESKNKESRQSLIDKFSDKEGFQIIVVSPIAAGTGLNITAANNVIHYTRHWNPAKEAQATDRVYRIGQAKEVNVYYPMSVMSDVKSFDVTLDELLAKKMMLSNYTMFPTPISDVNSSDFNHMFDINTQHELLFIDKEALLRFEQEYFQSFVAIAFKKRFAETILTPIKSNKGIDLLAFNELKTNRNYIIKVLLSGQELDKNEISDLNIANKYYDYTFNTNFKIIIATQSNALDDSENFEVLNIDDLFSLTDGEPITLKEVELMNKNRISSLESIQDMVVNS